MKKLLDFIYNLNYEFLMRNYILLESNPDFSDNTKGVYDELIKRHINDKYHIIWFVYDASKFKDIKVKNVMFITRNEKMLSKIRFMYYNLFAKYIIDCNKYIKKRNKNQFRIHLTHGTPLKVTTDYCKLSGKIDCLIQISDYFTDINNILFSLNKDKIISTGFPRNDYLFDFDNGIELFKDIKRNKTVLWLPTYRNHKNVKDSDIYSMKINFPFGIPTVSSTDELNKLNEILKENEILLLIKLHPVEDSSKIENFDFSNIKLIKDEYFLKEHTNIYQLMARVDALITDYSSVYYDFLLRDKPIGLAIPDIEEYKEHVALLFENYEDNIAGEYIYNFNDLLKFINNLAIDNDVAFEERSKKKKLYHKYCDNKSAERVVDILEKNM